MQPLAACARVHRPMPRPLQRAPGAAPDAGRARMREVIVDLPPHALDLLADRVRRARPGPPPPARSASCESTASGVFRPCARSPALAIARRDDLLAVVEQRVEVVDERLHFAGIGAFDAALAGRRERPTGAMRNWPNDARPAPHLTRRRRPCRRCAIAEARPTCDSARWTVMATVGCLHHRPGQREARHDEETDGPERGAEEHLRRGASAAASFRSPGASPPLRSGNRGRGRSR